ncbi:hypothetical protein CERSUDRAFT_127525 [Gelatoporia subvermispora B]|uniref:DUF6534 domain-containing protein n=1 Tax=Ceriporiopsis subvermispora (strain B) TaxID=914234 RepID=M2P7B9_CERS8|nr:hypothetical protein CERSUDRAFT_127525 [Gelatoporia subvermispora B]
MSALPIESILNSTFGACLLGLVAAATLYGITNVQTYMYFRRYPNDWIVLRIAVMILWVLDTVHQAFTTHGVYVLLVTRWGSLAAAIGPVPWSIWINVQVTTISDMIVRALWKFSGKRYLAVVPPVIGTILSIISGIIFAIQVTPSTSLMAIATINARSTYFGHINWSFYMGIASSVFADVWLTVSLVVVLRKRRTGFRRACELTSLVMYAVMPQNFVYYPFFMCIPKLLLNSLLANLNARQDMREIGSAQSGLISIPLPMTTYDPSGLKTAGEENVGIRVQKRIETRSDAATGFKG